MMYTNSKIGLAESDGAIWDFIESLEGANLAQKLLLAVLLYSFFVFLFLSTSPLSFSKLHLETLVHESRGWGLCIAYLCLLGLFCLP